jgi:hypothetical protein
MLIDLFMPKNQRALDGKLGKFKEHPDHVDPDTHAALSSVILPSATLVAAIEDLLQFNIITRSGRELHRVVQEAMNYLGAEDLQASFDSASALVYEAFPKPVYHGWLPKKWGVCQAYIHHGAHLSFLFTRLHRPGEKDRLVGWVGPSLQWK